jgi:predicted RNase H-like HicB family nuclease
MSALAYRVILEPEPEGGYNVVVPAFPHIHTCGDDVADALAMATDAIGLELAVMHDRGLPVPEPDGDSEVRIERVVVPAPAA